MPPPWLHTFLRRRLRHRRCRSCTRLKPEFCCVPDKNGSVHKSFLPAHCCNGILRYENDQKSLSSHILVPPCDVCLQFPKKLLFIYATASDRLTGTSFYQSRSKFYPPFLLLQGTFPFHTDQKINCTLHMKLVLNRH